MRVIEIAAFGGPEQLRAAERPTPAPTGDEVLIRVAAAGVNRPDILQRRGKYPPPAGASDIVGLEVAGEIVACGPGVTRWKSGDKVCALVSGGGYAEFCLAPEGQCLPIPGTMSMVEAAALPENIFTVWANLFEAGGLRQGETALVHGGSSGIGTIAIQMAKAQGARVFVTVGNDAKVAACSQLGADLAVNYHTQDFVEAVQTETQGQGVNVVLDMVGGTYMPRNLSVLAPFGRHVSIAVQGGSTAEVDLALVMRHRLTLTGSTLRSRPAAEKARLRQIIEQEVWLDVAAGAIKPLIYQVVPIKNAAEAHKVMESGAHIGKIVLETGAW